MLQDTLQSASVPVINAGDGANQHPTQTMLDLYTIKQTQGTLENLERRYGWRLKYGRTVHSLLQALSFFSPSFMFTAPEELKMPEEYKDFLKHKKLPTKRQKIYLRGLNDADILYMTRVQQRDLQIQLIMKRLRTVTDSPQTCLRLQRKT